MVFLPYILYAERQVKTMKKTFMFGVIAFLLLAMPIAIAQENASNETVEIKGGKDYPLLQRALDRIKLAFTLQVERRLALMQKIEQKRLEHYDFLIAKGKTEQAEAFKSRTVGLVKNFEEWKARKNTTVQRFENKTAEVRERAAERNETEEDMRNKSEDRGRPNQSD